MESRYFDAAAYLEIYEEYRGEKDYTKIAKAFIDAGFDSVAAMAAATRAANAD